MSSVPLTTDNPALATGRIVEQGQDDAGRWCDFTVPGTELRLRLRCGGEITPGHAGRITGEIKARARRVDVVTGGGRFIEPVFGRPRRVQGRIVGGRRDEATGEQAIIVLAGGMPIVATLTSPGQTLADFKTNQLAGFDVEPGATFTPA